MVDPIIPMIGWRTCTILPPWVPGHARAEPRDGPYSDAAARTGQNDLEKEAAGGCGDSPRLPGAGVRGDARCGSGPHNLP
jgi:hypothetical protein